MSCPGCESCFKPGCRRTPVHVQWFQWEPCEGAKGPEDWIVHVHDCDRHGHLHLCEKHYWKHLEARDSAAPMNWGIDHETGVVYDYERVPVPALLEAEARMEARRGLSN